MSDHRTGKSNRKSQGFQRLVATGILVSVLLAVIKIATGILGNSWALVADGLESVTDVITSVVVFASLSVSLRPPDREHPWGHGGAGTFGVVFVALAILGATGLIAWQSIHEILRPHVGPSWVTLPILVVVIVVKILVARKLHRRGMEEGLSPMRSDAVHHLSDAITSGAAFIGISIALLGGKGWESSDDWAALLACVVLLYNGLVLLREGLDQMMDAAIDPATEAALRRVARAVEGVKRIEKCRTRSNGLGLLMEIHVEVDENLSVREGHDIAGAVKAALLQTRHNVLDVVVHIEPYGGK